MQQLDWAKVLVGCKPSFVLLHLIEGQPQGPRPSLVAHMHGGYNYTSLFESNLTHPLKCSVRAGDEEQGHAMQ